MISRNLFTTLSMLIITYPYTMKLTAPMTLTTNLGGTTHGRVLVESASTLRRVHGISIIMFSGAKALARKRPAMVN